MTASQQLSSVRRTRVACTRLGRGLERYCRIVRRVDGGHASLRPPYRSDIGWSMDRSPLLTIFWHCGPSAFSSRTTPRRAPWQRTVNGFGRGFWRLTGSGNADSQRKGWGSGWSGRCRPCDSGCDAADPPSWRASASYRPLRAVWAVCAWALRGCARTPKPFSAHEMAQSTQKEALQ